MRIIVQNGLFYYIYIYILDSNWSIDANPELIKDKEVIETLKRESHLIRFYSS